MGKYVSVTANEGGRTRTDGSNHQVTSMLRLFLPGMVAPWSNGWVGTQSPSFWGPVQQFSRAIVVLYFLWWSLANPDCTDRIGTGETLGVYLKNVLTDTIKSYKQCQGLYLLSAFNAGNKNNATAQ